jgi:hypothetical protein
MKVIFVDAECVECGKNGFYCNCKEPMTKQCFKVSIQEITIHEVITPPCNTPEEAEQVALDILEEGGGEIVESTFEAGDIVPTEEDYDA